MRRPGGALLEDPDVVTVDEYADDVGGLGAPRVHAAIVVLCVAASLLLVVPGFLAADERGYPSMAPPPVPPPIGSCVTWTDDQAPVLDVVDCAQPHSGEVAMTWPAGVTPVDLDLQPIFLPSAWQAVPWAYFQCSGWALDYVGAPAALDGGLVSAPPVYRGRLVPGAADGRFAKWSWTACVVLPVTPATYQGSVHGMAASPGSATPDVMLGCLRVVEPIAWSYLDCAQPHTREPIALAVDTTPEAADPQARCVAAARTVTGASDPTYGGQLELILTDVVRDLQAPLAEGSVAEGVAGVGVDPGGGAGEISVSTQPVPRQQDCVAALVGPGLLTGSIVGLGDRPLPVQR